MLSCPECGSSLYSQTVDFWLCNTCGYKEGREDSFAMSVKIIPAGYDLSVHIPIPEKMHGSLERFFELRKQDEEAALTYLEFMEFSSKENLNRHYLAAQLSIKLKNQQSADEHLTICLSEKPKAKRPESIEKLHKLYRETFESSDPDEI